MKGFRTLLLAGLARYSPREGIADFEVLVLPAVPVPGD
jgi:hypothetical protein